MEKIKIVIPSHKRADKVATKTLVHNPIICVAKSQAAEYKEYNPAYEIVTHPDSVVGLPRKRQWCYEYFKDLWMMDDDLITIKKVYDEDYDLTPDIVTRALQNIYELSVDLGVYLFGISKNPRPNQYSSHSPISLTGIISGGTFGIRDPKKSKLWFNPELLNNDFWISFLNAYTNRTCLIDKRFAFIQKDTFANPGGLAEFRTVKAMEEDYRQMKRYFGDSVYLKKDRLSAKSKVKWALSGHINF